MRAQSGQRGFTLIEMMIVIGIILILVGTTVPIYKQHVLNAKEAVLRQDLYILNKLIDEYTLDKQRAPQSLEDLVSAGYLRELPKDPFTNSADTWVTEQEDVMLSIDQTQPGISRVRSGSDQIGSDGRAYSEW